MVAKHTESTKSCGKATDQTISYNPEDDESVFPVSGLSTSIVHKLS